MIEIELLPAEKGDCIWLRYGEGPESLHHVLIDTGYESCGNELRRRLRDDGDLALDLFVLTHIDEDHIKGGVFLLQDPQAVSADRVGDVWFNGWPHINEVAPDALGALQGTYFSALINDRGLRWNGGFGGRAVSVPAAGPLPKVTLPGGMTITVLSPTRAQLDDLRTYWVSDLRDRLDPADEERALELLGQDPLYELDELGSSFDVERLAETKFTEHTTAANASSIAFLAECGGKRLLFAGDATPTVLVASLDRLLGDGEVLDIDAFKVSHHGSCGNTSPELIERVHCKHVLISTNGVRHSHPHPECIARLVHAHKVGDLTLHFNYKTDYTEPWDDPVLRRRYDYKVEFGDEGHLTLEL